MNIPSPMTQKTFSNIQESIGSSYVKSAEANMKAAADDVRITMAVKNLLTTKW